MPDTYEIVHLNDIAAPESIAYLLKYDSIHGTWAPEVEYADGFVTITDGNRTAKIACTQQPDVSKARTVPAEPCQRAYSLACLLPRCRAASVRPHAARWHDPVCGRMHTLLLQHHMQQRASHAARSAAGAAADRQAFTPRALVQIDYGAVGAQLVMEGTGVNLTRAKLQPYFDAGLSKVVVSAPVKDADRPVLNIVVGCNEVRARAARACLCVECCVVLRPIATAPVATECCTSVQRVAGCAPARPARSGQPAAARTPARVQCTAPRTDHRAPFWAPLRARGAHAAQVAGERRASTTRRGTTL